MSNITLTNYAIDIYNQTLKNFVTRTEFKQVTNDHTNAIILNFAIAVIVLIVCAYYLRKLDKKIKRLENTMGEKQK